MSKAAKEFRKKFFQSRYYTRKRICECMEAYHQSRVNAISEELMIITKDEFRNKLMQEEEVLDLDLVSYGTGFRNCYRWFKNQLLNTEQ
jgi:hypothetical protein